MHVCINASQTEQPNGSSRSLLSEEAQSFGARVPSMSARTSLVLARAGHRPHLPVLMIHMQHLAANLRDVRVPASISQRQHSTGLGDGHRRHLALLGDDLGHRHMLHWICGTVLQCARRAVRLLHQELHVAVRLWLGLKELMPQHAAVCMPTEDVRRILPAQLCTWGPGAGTTGASQFHSSGSTYGAPRVPCCAMAAQCTLHGHKKCKIWRLLKAAPEAQFSERSNG